MFNKKGQSMTIGTLVTIILAVILLVFVVYGFSVGWSNLFGQLTNLGGGKVNVQTIVQACQVACATQSTFDYCKERSVIYDANKDSVVANCNELEQNRLRDGTSIGSTGLQKCVAIPTCAATNIKGNCEEKQGQRASTCSAGNNKGTCDIENPIPGCKWVPRTGGASDNDGECVPNSDIKCTTYNNNFNSCTRSGCTWISTV